MWHFKIVWFLLLHDDVQTNSCQQQRRSTTYRNNTCWNWNVINIFNRFSFFFILGMLILLWGQLNIFAFHIIQRYLNVASWNSLRWMIHIRYVHIKYSQYLVCSWPGGIGIHGCHDFDQFSLGWYYFRSIGVKMDSVWPFYWQQHNTQFLHRIKYIFFTHIQFKYTIRNTLCCVLTFHCHYITSSSRINLAGVTKRKYFNSKTKFENVDCKTTTILNRPDVITSVYSVLLTRANRCNLYFGPVY